MSQGPDHYKFATCLVGLPAPQLVISLIMSPNLEKYSSGAPLRALFLRHFQNFMISRSLSHLDDISAQRDAVCVIFYFPQYLKPHPH